jgi:Glycosyltransferase family 87
MKRVVHCATAVIADELQDCGPPTLNRSAWLALAIVCLLSSWYFAVMIAPAGLKANAPTVQQGVFPEWFGSRQILLHGRDPYSAATTREIQNAIYGAPVGADWHNLNQHRFAYPVFFAFLFFPLAILPFGAAQLLALAGCIVATALSVVLWLRGDGHSIATWTRVAFVFAGYPVLLGLQLRQPTLIIAALLAILVYCIRSNRLAIAGALAALSLCKPQIAIAVVLPVSIWSIAGWPARKRFLLAMLVGLGGLLTASEWVSPGWFLRWMGTLRAYAQYVGSKPLLSDLLRGHLLLPAAITLVGAVVSVSRHYCERDLPLAICFSIASFQLLFPFQIYNQVMLVPVALWMAGNAAKIQGRGQLHALLYGGTWMVLAAGWAASIGLSLARLIAPSSSPTLWYMPLLMAWIYPFTVFFTLAVCASPPRWWIRRIRLNRPRAPQSP